MAPFEKIIIKCTMTALGTIVLGQEHHKSKPKHKFYSGP